MTLPLFSTLVWLAGSAGLALATRLEGVRLSAVLLVAFSAAPPLLAYALSPPNLYLTTALWTLPMVFLLSALSAMDAATRTVADGLTLPLIVFGLAHIAMTPRLLIAHGVAVGLLIAVSIALNLARRGQPGWIGSGDILLLAGALAWLGPALSPDVLMVSAIALMLQALIFPGPRSDMPLAPALSLGQMVIWFGGPIF